MAKHVEEFVATADFDQLDSALGKTRARVENFKKEISKARKEIRATDTVTVQQGKSLVAMERRLKLAQDEMKGATKESKKLTKALSGTAAAADDAAENVDKVGKESKKTGQDFTGVSKAAQAAGGKVGELSEKSRNLAEALGSTAGLAAVGALALAGFAVVGFKTAQAAIQGTAALVGLVRQSDELLEATEPFRDLDGFILSGSDIDGLREGKDALDALDAISAQFSTKLAAEISPAVGRVATLLVAAGLAGLDAFNTLTEGVDFWSKALTSAQNFALSPTTEGIRLLAEGAIALAEFMGQDVPDGLKEFVDSTRLVRVNVDQMSSGLAVLEGAAGGYLARAEEMIGVQGDVNTLAREGTKAWDDHVKAIEQQVAALQKIAKISNTASLAMGTDLDKLIAKRNEQLAVIDQEVLKAGESAIAEELAAQAKIAVNQKFFSDRFELAAAAAEADQQERAKFDAIELAAFTEKEKQKQAVAKATRDAIISAGTDAANALIDGFSETNRRFLAGQEAQIDAQIAALESKDQLTKAEADGLKRLEKEKERLALFDFRRTKAASIAKAVISTAVLALSASAPPPAGIGFPQGAIAAGLVGATQIGIIATQRPPKFHGGGVVPGAPGAEVNATVLPQESVLTQQVTRDAGGEDGIRQINGGSAPIAPQISIFLDSREVTFAVLQRMQGDNATPRQPSGRNHVGMEASFAG